MDQSDSRLHIEIPSHQFETSGWKSKNNRIVYLAYNPTKFQSDLAQLDVGQIVRISSYDPREWPEIRRTMRQVRAVQGETRTVGLEAKGALLDQSV
ncbi:Hypothetical protein NTJ_13227 [Nesidiocoris tenuis]|uniref:Uncharacterized protein n=1 Tax=Nesidiocoris tenuis TaxID=355587 RepID=A0ABN7BB58_9HEMI|nr:Hypothetical protein NTJ_13227 [Nesidiocoris tenuis]